MTTTRGTESPAETASLAPPATDTDARAIITIRLLAADAVQAAGSGHPGLPMGAAAAAYTLWSRFLRHDPSRPGWPDRDRFVLSAGHGSALLYALLHLSGYDLSLEDLRAFRQWGSKAPGHPEHGHTPGVETTTGPLGQGLGNAVGMALAERMLASRYNVPGLPPVVGHRTFVLASDGDLMEGISHEAASLAGHLRLGRLIVLYDDNEISIDGDTSLACGDDVERRFAGYGWQVRRVADGNDTAAISAALREAAADETRPSLIALRTRIGYGSPAVEGTAKAHGAPLGDGELARVKARFGWPAGRSFHVPSDVRRRFAELADAGARTRQDWEDRLDALRSADPRRAAEWDRTQAGWLPAGIDGFSTAFAPEGPVATRTASGKALRDLARVMPELVGGSADLTGSTCTDLAEGWVAPGDYGGRGLRFGVREHAMGAALNGIALHGGLRPFGSTFLVFSDYMRPAIRLAALMKLPVIYVFTHDSVAVGEDGPTHQPVEHLAALRTIPGLAVLRPADANETAAAWELAARRLDGPTALVLSRQGLPVLPPPGGTLIREGARVAREGSLTPDVVLIATGSEVSLALEAADLLAAGQVTARVVSVPWRERFLATRLREEILPAGVPRVIVEAGSTDPWRALAGPSGTVIGVDSFGASGPGPEVMTRLGLSAPRVRDAALEVIARAASPEASAAARPGRSAGR
ncbi:MAG: transketolase [Streptosporangiales bacterium]|nr:transketolase [Streptosporangiales bacterium]